MSRAASRARLHLKALLRGMALSALSQPLARQIVRRERVRALEQAFAAGLPSVLAEPLRFLASGNVSSEGSAVQAMVEEVRASVPSSRGVAVLGPYGEGGRSTTDLAKETSVSKEWGTFLHLCAKAVKAETILELGVAAGISGCYLALSPACKAFYGLEGSSGRMELARANFAGCGLQDKANLILGQFEETLPRLLESDVAFDLVWIDGDHGKESTLSIFEQVIPHLRPGSLVVFDDIRWSDGMWEAWRRLRQWRGFDYTIDLRRVGAGIWGGGEDEPKTWDLRSITWPLGIFSRR